MTIIHITRELKLVRVYGANGNENLIRGILQRQDVEAEVVRKSIEDGYLSHERLEQYLANMLKEDIPDGEAIEVCAY